MICDYLRKSAANFCSGFRTLILSEIHHFIQIRQDTSTLNPNSSILSLSITLNSRLEISHTHPAGITIAYSEGVEMCEANVCSINGTSPRRSPSTDQHRTISPLKLSIVEMEICMKLKATGFRRYTQIRILRHCRTSLASLLRVLICVYL
jgi:hypothetical protein